MEGLHMGEEEPRYDKQDLEQDLYLAAELGKTLLERNREMEDSLQELYLTSEEQVQEIEYLSKQLEMLREMNEQHAKVYEQLDVSAHKLELTNQKLVEESKESQQKIERLTGTMEALQNQVDSLTARVEELRALEQLRARTELRAKHKTVHSFPCFQELCAMGRCEEGTVRNLEMEQSSLEEENEGLREVVASLQAAMSSERSRREGVQQECARMLQQSACLEERLLVAEGCQQHVLELEAEMRELQQLGGIRGADRPDGVPDTPTAVAEGQAREEGAESKGKVGGTGLVPPDSTSVHKSCSDTALNSIGGRDAPGRKPAGYGPRANGMPGQGMSILREVDEQYHALLERYEELLGKCRRREDSLHHAEVQTSRPVSRDSSTRDCTSLIPPSNAVPTLVSPEALDGDEGPETEDSCTGHHTPEYKALFKEIFSHIQKTKVEGKSSKSRKGKK